MQCGVIYILYLFYRCFNVHKECFIQGLYFSLQLRSFVICFPENIPISTDRCCLLVTRTHTCSLSWQNSDYRSLGTFLCWWLFRAVHARETLLELDLFFYTKFNIKLEIWCQLSLKVKLNVIFTLFSFNAKKINTAAPGLEYTTKHECLAALWAR